MSEAQFRKGLRAAVRGLFTGVLDVGEFDESMEKAINRHLRQAWKEGALECGIGEDEYSEEETKVLNDFLVNQYEYIPGFTVAIVDNKKSDEPNIETLFSRVNLWVDRYSEAKANGHAMACSNQKARFNLGTAKEHCSSCKGLNGRVYRYSVWIKYNAVPPHNWNFECRGGCKCALVTTNDPVTKGRFPVGLLR
jgi:hypothetical protein